MVKIRTCLKWLFVGLILFFIYAPILLLTINSFNQSNTIKTWTGFSLEHYKYFFSFDNEPLPIVLETLLLAAIVATLSTLLGTVGAIGIFYSNKRASSALKGINQIPVINAEVVTAISFALLVAFLEIDKSTFIPLVLGQMVLCTPFVVLSVIPKLRQMDNNLYEAALDLGATPTRALFTVIVPQILPGIVSGFLLAVTLSLDDYVIAAYTKPGTFQTISTHIYGLTKGKNVAEIKASYWAFTAVIFAIIVIVLITTNIISYKKTRSKQQ
ncbi:MAG: ABC transporter permease [Firmicutes bacterium]|jgi:spermidine/putrescine ABC transporter, permease protein potC|nr:ABC transporter permease [Clostridia bacterium]MBS5022684.1 ABC transporter permease [Bacillota bacterium]